MGNQDQLTNKTPIEQLESDIRRALYKYKAEAGGNVSNISMKWDRTSVGERYKMLTDVFIEVHND